MLRVKELSEELRRKILHAIDILEDKKIFIHSEPLLVRLHGELIRLPLISTLITINALVARGSMLLYGGYGGGKTTLVKVLGRLLTGESIRDIEASIVRAHPQLTEEKIVGRLDAGKLLRDGSEVIIWRRFISSFWKIIDEINRLSPSAQDTIFSILSEGIAKYFDAVYETKEYVFYATVNPRDVGSYQLGLPLLDRFGMAVPISMPRYDELVDITDAPDDKLHEWTDDSIPAVLSKHDLIVIWNLVSRVELDDEARLFISVLTREFSACVRTRKELGTFIDLAESICKGCHFNTDSSICNKVHTPLSVRASKDLVRYSKALSWLLGLQSVPLNVVFAIAPYVIWHRISLSSKYLERFYGDTFTAVKHLIDIAFRNFIKRLPLYKDFMRLERGLGEITIFDALEKSVASDLTVATDLYPLAKLIIESNYLELAREINKAMSDGKLDLIIRKLNKMHDELPRDLRGRLMRIVENMMKQNKRTFVFRLSEWDRVLDKLISVEPSFQILKSVKPTRSMIKHANFNDVHVSVHFTGNSPNDPVFLDVFCLNKASRAISIISEVLDEVSRTER